MATEEDVKLAERLAELEEKIRAGRAEEEQLAEAIKDLTEAQIEKLLQVVDLNEKIKAQLKQQQANEQTTLEKAADRLKDLHEANDLLKQQLELTDKSYQKSVLTKEIQKNTIRARRDEIKLLQQKLNKQQGLSDEDAERLDHLEKLDKKLETFGRGASDIAQGLFSGDASGIQGALSGIASTMKGELTDSIQQAVMGSESLGAGLKAATGAMGALAIYTLVEQTLALAVSLGDTENAFMKATGASEDFARSISRTYAEGRKFTATAEDMSKSATSLFNTFTDFTLQDQQTRDGLIETGAVLEKLGVSNENFAQGIQIATKGLSMSSEDAGQSMLDLQKFAEELGVAPDMLAGQFAEAGDTLMKLGENGDEAFRDLAAAAKVTGLQVNKLLNIVNQFDTFEGAARQAGKLNAALGGNFVNAMDLMMETDPTARFEQIRDAILDTGLSFDSMSYYQKNFYKDALGLDSVGDLALALSGNMDSVSEETKKTSQDFEDAAERAKTLASFQEQLNAVFAQMIPILTPLIDAFRGLLGFISDNAGVIKVLAGALVGFAVGGPIGLAIGAVVMLADSVKVGSEKLSGLGLILEGLFLPFTALFDIMKFVSDKIHEFTGSVGGAIDIGEELIPIFKGIGFVLGVLILLPLLKVLTGVKLAIVVFGLFAGAVKGLMGAFAEKNSPSFFDMFTGGLLAQSIEALMTPFNAFKAMLETIGGIFSSIMSGVVAFFTALTDPTAAANIEKIAAAIAEVPVTNAIALGSAMGNVGEALQIQASVGNNDVMNKSMEVASGLSEATFNRTAAPVAANTNISQNSSKTTYVNSGPETAVFDVRIGDEKLGRVVQKISNKNISNSMTGRN